MQPLPREFLDTLPGHDEVLVTSRGGLKEGTVAVWFVVLPPGVVYLFGSAFSLRANRWRLDPWVRLRVPGTRVSAEGKVSFVEAEELDAVAPLIVDTWQMWGATTVEGLRRMIREGSHVLVRVEGTAAPAPRE